METIHLIQLIGLILGTLLTLGSEFKSRFDGYMFLAGISLFFAFVVSLLYTQPPAHAFTIAIQRVLPGMSALMAYQVLNVLTAPIIGALICYAGKELQPTRLGFVISRIILWVAQINLLQLLIVLCLCLASCRPKPAQTPTTPSPVPTIDTTRQTLQRQANASRVSAEQASKSSQSSVTTYERDVKTYDSIQVKLR